MIQPVELFLAHIFPPVLLVATSLSERLLPGRNLLIDHLAHSRIDNIDGLLQHLSHPDTLGFGRVPRKLRVEVDGLQRLNLLWR